MRIITLTILLINAILIIQAQNYLIDFAGTGASTNVDSVKIENLSQCTSLIIAGTDILNLTATVGISESGRYQDQVSVSPNPSSGHCSVVFDATSNNYVCFGLFDMSGQVVLQQKEFLPQGHHTFQLVGIPGGIYVLKIESGNFLYSVKLVSNATLKGSHVIKKAESAIHLDDQKNISEPREMKNMSSTKSIIGMQFNIGDTLKLTGKSGNYMTVSMLFPNQNQTVTFNFVKCTDADSNNYAVVQIGTQLWMQENLKATKYRDGSGIPNITDSATWANITTGAYCNFHNDTSEGTYYGRLYNYYAVADSRKICPIGWHVASNAEWNIMEMFTDNTVDTTALGGTGLFIGRMLKEGCNTRWQYYDSTAGWNSAGFTALCSNFRTTTGSWSLAPNNNHDDSFWTATPYNSNMAWNKSFRWCACDIYNIFIYNRAGSSVRCIKDQ